ncbi:F0F1 ATP synthase subunit epsilon [Rhizobium sp. SSA_523]|uniref:F0F1 ATP synthase subunit epsilon n=1 Tax=Rhizobium sp. SSA_523 TaxID=2952477 RepID=UPI002091AF23|nr:F0F1 ATP synthase subunit epsilon [Rhizobium sp. SSA_523]MCO5733606.1 F0F1 ATP synthase subunit epsilon [Rhizobium sp. SSA_523]WKC23097.1 F0F1 ATP synthase subunit epsilon [Rhizobium sp. SSA_523]
MADSFQFELVSPERLLLSEKVTEVVIPATLGEMTVMAKHAPTMTTIKPGMVTVKLAAGGTKKYVVFGGFADILPTGCTLLAESAVPQEEVNRDLFESRIASLRQDITDAPTDEHRTQLELMLSELTHLNKSILPG